MTSEDEVGVFQPVKSADRTVDVVEALASAEDPVALGELARKLSIPKSSLHGILRTLQRRGWVDTDPSGLRFRIGLRALQAGAAYIDGDDGVQRAQPVLDWLAEQSGETVQLARLDGANVVYLAKRGSRHPVQLISAVGTRLPANATALGKAMLASLDPAEVRALLPEKLPALTPYTIVDRERLLEDLEATRVRGHAVDDQEAAEGLRCFAVAVWTSPRQADAISFSVPTFRLNPTLERKLVDLLRVARDRIGAGPAPHGSRPLTSAK